LPQEIERVLREVDFIESEALAQLRALRANADKSTAITGHTDKD